MLAVQQRGAWCSLNDLVLRTTYTHRRLRDVVRALVEAGLLRQSRHGLPQYTVTRKGEKWRPALRENEIRRLEWTNVGHHPLGGNIHVVHLARHTWTANAWDSGWAIWEQENERKSGGALSLREAKATCKKWLRFYMNEGKR